MKLQKVVLNKLLLSQLLGVEGDVIFAKVTNNTDEVEISFLELSKDSGLSELTQNNRISRREVLTNQLSGIKVENGDLYMQGNLTTVSEEDSCVTIKNGDSTILINEDGTIEIKGKEIKFSNNNHYNNTDTMINGLSERGIKFN